MDDNTKSLIKKTLLGLTLGSTAAAAYSLFNDQDGKKDGKEEEDGRIVVPLSRKHFLKALEAGKKTVKKEEKAMPAEKKSPPADLTAMTPQELAAFKKSIIRMHMPLRKAAEAPQAIAKRESTKSTVTNIRSTKDGMVPQNRDASGRFAKGSEKKAEGSFWENSKGVVKDTTGLTLGLFAGTYAMKALCDRIALNRKKNEVELARRAYVKLLNKEVTDTDEPYYKRAEDHRSWLEGAVGQTMAVGVGAGALSALVMYRILENRRKELERDADKDTSNFPKDKSVEFKFI